MLQIIQGGYNFTHPDGVTIDRPNGIEHYAFVLFKSKTNVIINNQSYVVDRNSYILIRPSTSYLYCDLEKPFINDWFHCNGDEDLADLLSHLDIPVDTPMRAVDPLHLSKYIFDLHHINFQGGPLCEQIIDADLKSFFLKLSNMQQQRAALPELSNRYLSEFSELRNQIYLTPQIQQSVDSLAAQLNLSKSYFQHIYKDLFGCPVTVDIIKSRLEYAKFLLDSSLLSVAAVSKMCGYANESHFMRQFKKYVGVTPSQYKSRQHP
ncbi:AraC family transcriptional regulator [Paenibacillus sambharensis]|uniref:AraC family transcriptional regulator n=1 Tax=Paenibacillus sambharensis TaxID=1803190 RepID=A0A2W1L9H6_9BACL|nr:AraC family transcriptional regulator [Paenibacillus sambharensis]PZD96858.1 AraC family transcriptional regulator [Paenibacillus sambharensis]